MKKKGLWLGLLSGVFALALVGGTFSAPVKANAATISTVTDTCDSVSSGPFSSISKMRVSTTDYGSGTDGKYQMSNFTPTAPVTLSTWSSGGYPYVRYALSGQNVITVQAWEDTKNMGLFDPVFCFVKYSDNSNVQLEVNNTVVGEGTSKGWTKVSYTYIIPNPETASWIQLTSSSYDLESTTDVSERDYQCITNVEISYMETLPEADTVATIEDVCDDLNAVANGYYRLMVSSSDLGFGADGKYRIQTLNPTAPPTAETYGEYSYVRYNLSGQNFLEVKTMEDPAKVGVLNPVFCRVRYADKSGVVLEMNNTVVEASTNWCRVTYTFIIPNAENASWVDCIPTAYVDEANGFTKSDQQITNVKISYENPTLLATKRELRSYATAKGQSNYQATDWADIQTIVSKALTAIDGAADETAVAAIVTQAKLDMDAVKTLAQEFAELKVAKKQEISDYAVNKGIGNYKSAAWASIIGYVTSAQSAIDEATDGNGVDAAMATAKEQIDAVKTILQEEQGQNNGAGNAGGTTVESPPTTGTSSDSCSSGIVGSGVFGAFLCVAVALFVRKKEN